MARGYIGLDVHKEQIVIGMALGKEEPFIHGRCSSDLGRFLKALRGALKKYELKKDEVSICYEAGPCGFVLARHLLRMGSNVVVIAPSLIPAKSGDRIKTDKRDAKKLARLYRAGELSGMHIQAYPEKYEKKYGFLKPVVEDVVNKYLDCGDLTKGFARIYCENCKKSMLLPFSCKGRWFCPSCHEKKVLLFGKFITGTIAFPVPHRQYVFSLPIMLRVHFRNNRQLLKKLCRIAALRRQ